MDLKTVPCPGRVFDPQNQIINAEWHEIKLPLTLPSDPKWEGDVCVLNIGLVETQLALKSHYLGKSCTMLAQFALSIFEPNHTVWNPNRTIWH